RPHQRPQVAPLRLRVRPASLAPPAPGRPWPAAPGTDGESRRRGGDPGRGGRRRPPRVGGSGDGLRLLGGGPGTGDDAREAAGRGCFPGGAARPRGGSVLHVLLLEEEQPPGAEGAEPTSTGGHRQPVPHHPDRPCLASLEWSIRVVRNGLPMTSRR